MSQKPTHPMVEIPISAAKTIAHSYGYDQVVIMARRVGEEPNPHGEHVTTYGIDHAHCVVAAAMGNALKQRIGWPSQQDVEDLDALYDSLQSGTFDYLEYDDASRQIGALRRLLGK